MDDAWDEYVASRKREQRLREYDEGDPIDTEEIEGSTPPEDTQASTQPEEAQVLRYPAEFSRPCLGALVSHREPISPFKILPAEIRVQIFSLLLAPTEPLNLDHPRNYTHNFMTCPYRLPWQPTALFLLDKQTYKEAAAIYYGKNQIRLRDPLAMGEFMGAIGKRSRPNLRRIVVVMTAMVDNAESWQCLQFCEGLEELVLEIGHNTFNGQANARNNFRKLKGLPSLLKVRGLKEVDVKMITGRLGMTAEREVIWRERLLDALQVLKEERRVVAHRGNKRRREDEDVEMGDADEVGGNENDSTAGAIVTTQPPSRKRPIRPKKARECKRRR
ncbi:MAG: hypothetical protein Q9187_007461 [Circinaria calcarea]